MKTPSITEKLPKNLGRRRNPAPLDDISIVLSKHSKEASNFFSFLWQLLKENQTFNVTCISDTEPEYPRETQQQWWNHPAPKENQQYSPFHPETQPSCNSWHTPTPLLQH